VEGPLETGVLEREIRDSLGTRYPRQFRAVHRSVLSVRNRQYNLDGYLRVDISAGFRFQAGTGFGMSMFELAYHDGAVEVIGNNGILENELLMTGPARDLLAFYFERPSPHARLSASTAGPWILTDDIEAGTIKVYRFERDSHRLLQYSVERGRRILYDAKFSEFDQGRYAFPRRIQVTSRKPRYTLEIQVVEMSVDNFDAEAVFSGVDDE